MRRRAGGAIKPPLVGGGPSTWLAIGEPRGAGRAASGKAGSGPDTNQIMILAWELETSREFSSALCVAAIPLFWTHRLAKTLLKTNDGAVSACLGERPSPVAPGPLPTFRGPLCPAPY
jgi:hypothetical protein